MSPPSSPSKPTLTSLHSRSRSLTPVGSESGGSPGKMEIDKGSVRSTVKPGSRGSAVGSVKLEEGMGDHPDSRSLSRSRSRSRSGSPHRPTIIHTLPSTTATTTTTTTTTAQPPASPTIPLPAVLSRPPIRPPINSISKSKFELEPNPFEQSFSRSSTSVQTRGTEGGNGNGNGGPGAGEGGGGSSEDDARREGRRRSTSPALILPRGALKADIAQKGLGLDSRGMVGMGQPTSTSTGPGQMTATTTTTTTALPPVSALTSPAPLEPGPHFSWSGLSSSLRAGPLSPAMLTGPTQAGHQAHHSHSHSHSHLLHHPNASGQLTHGPSSLSRPNTIDQLPSSSSSPPSPTGLTPHIPGGNPPFDPSAFRTGFTPGAGTGFTPNGFMGLPSMGGLPAFPLPSPNTAAFLSMVTNNTPGAGGSGPGTAGGGVGGEPGMAGAGGGGMTGVGPHGHGHGHGAGEDPNPHPHPHPHPHPGRPSRDHPPNPSSMVDITPNTLNALTGVINQMDCEEQERVREEGRRGFGVNGHGHGHGQGQGGGMAGMGNGIPQASLHQQQQQQQQLGQQHGQQHAQHGHGHGQPQTRMMHHQDSYFPHQPSAGQGGHSQAQSHPPSTGNPMQFHPGGPHGIGPHSMHHPQPGGAGGPTGQQQQTLPPSHLHSHPGIRPGQMDFVRTDPNGHTVPPLTGSQQGTSSSNPGSAAVNGLFLLSQAHQELSKLEEQEQGVSGEGSGPATGKQGGKKGARGSKRKITEDGLGPGSGSGAGTGKKPAAKKGRKSAGNSTTANVEPPSPDYMNSLNGDMDDDEMAEMGYGNGADDEDGTRSGKPETEEEKRKNFLERNRQAALKCRQRKKAWLTSLQSKVDGLSGENDRLRAIIQNLTDEVGRISAVMSSHRDCPGMPASMAQLGIALPPPGGQGMPPPQGGMGMMPPPPPGPPGAPGGLNGVGMHPGQGYRHGSAAPGGHFAGGQAQAV